MTNGCSEADGSPLARIAAICAILNTDGTFLAYRASCSRSAFGSVAFSSGEVSGSVAFDFLLLMPQKRANHLRCKVKTKQKEQPPQFDAMMR